MRYFKEKECPDYDGRVFTLDDFKMDLDDNLQKIELLEMRRDYGGQMWCQDNREFVVKGEDCGIQCPLYSPCNGKSGRCRELKNGFVETGREFLLTKDGLREVN